MKRSLFLAALSTMAAGSALAQSTITVYGRLNESFEHQKVGSVKSNSLANSNSRIGFKGAEDLGGGLKATFLLEHGFNPDNGTASDTTAFWGRESTVGLSGGFGSVRLGNMGPSAAYFATADYISMHNHDTGTSADAFYLYPGSTKNSVAYKTPNYAGLEAEVQFGIKENQARNTGVVALNYDVGSLHLGLGYVQGPAALAGEAFNKSRELGLRALYEIGAFTVGAYYIRNELEEPAVAPASGVEAKRDAYRVSGMYVAGPLELHANVGAADKIKVNGVKQDGTNALQYTLGANYNLSKRTKLYTFYTKVDNKENIAYNPGNPNGFITAQADGDDLQSIAFGIRHNF